MIDNLKYKQDVAAAAGCDLPWEKLNGKSFLITGASGLIGSFLTDVLMYRNINNGMNCHVIAMGRSVEKAKAVFGEYMDMDTFSFVSHDINLPLDSYEGKVDFLLHLASNTHPVAYSTDPIGTIASNIIGLKNLLDFAAEHGTERFAFASSNEIYGENRGDTEFFDEEYCGYIDCNTLRAGYPESKRCGEALCQAYRRAKDMDVVIPRLTRSYGATMLKSDTKAISQFIKKGIAGEDIVLKSEGNQYYSYTYAPDAVTGLLTVILKGVDGEAYNIADEKSDIRLKDLATLIAGFSGAKVVFELPDKTEQLGYSKATKARLDSKKIKALGWQPAYTIETGIERTLQILTDK